LKAWEIYTADIFGEHPCVLVSCQPRIDAKPEIVVMGCRTMRPANEREPRANEVLLDEADGLDLKTLCRCDLLFTWRGDARPPQGNRPKDHSGSGHRRIVGDLTRSAHPPSIEHTHLGW
jgi:hypothetical protein